MLTRPPRPVGALRSLYRQRVLLAAVIAAALVGGAIAVV
jgi:hypothetical protein